MDNRPEKVVELKPSEWTSDREKPREPVFGPGAWAVLPYWVCLFGTFFVIQAAIAAWKPAPAPVIHTTSLGIRWYVER